jgi:hypothetical protein
MFEVLIPLSRVKEWMPFSFLDQKDLGPVNICKLKN